jgi:hypothetical protein
METTTEPRLGSKFAAALGQFMSPRDATLCL